MAIEKHDTTENTLIPVSEKYTLTIKEAASYSVSYTHLTLPTMCQV